MPSIAVRNFGPIAHAEVDLKPLTVLIGSNNTGKSYFALAVYSLFQAVLRIRDQKYRPTRSRTTLKPMYVHEDSVQRVTNAGGDWNRIKPDVVKVISGAAKFHNLPAKIKEIDRQMKHDGLAIEVGDKLTGLSWNMRGTGDNLIVDRWEPNTSIMSESDYVFEPGDRGTQVTPLSVDGDYGISTASFDAVHRALYDEAVKMEHGG